MPDSYPSIEWDPELGPHCASVGTAPNLQVYRIENPRQLSGRYAISGPHPPDLALCGNDEARASPQGKRAQKALKATPLIVSSLESREHWQTHQPP
jgi:hypothetical protein